MRWWIVARDAPRLPVQIAMNYAAVVTLVQPVEPLVFTYRRVEVLEPSVRR